MSDDEIHGDPASAAGGNELLEDEVVSWYEARDDSDKAAHSRNCMASAAFRGHLTAGPNSKKQTYWYDGTASCELVSESEFGSFLARLGKTYMVSLCVWSLVLIFVVSSTYLHWQFRVNLTKKLRLREVIGAARRFHEGEGRDAYNSLVSDQDGHGLWIRGLMRRRKSRMCLALGTKSQIFGCWRVKR
jgi:hypothetical protein